MSSITDMDNNYREYNTEQLAQDSSFIRWARKKEPSDTRFWEKWLLENPDKEQEVKQARRLVKAIRFEAKEMTDDRVEALWAKITAAQDNTAQTARVFNLKRILPLTIAASLALLLVFRFVLPSNNTGIDTLAGQTLAYTLPDGSQVTLNAGSSLKFNPKTWEGSRRVNLEGEAYFEVTKGSTFDVVTDNGTVSVLGTSFNVFSRNADFKVVCYEGKVSVATTDRTVQTILTPGMGTRLSAKNLETFSHENSDGPSWRTGMFEFSSEKLSAVFEELERQFKVNITAEPDVLNSTYTGFFEKENLEMALQAICWPKQLTYTINGSTIRIETLQNNN